jgi:hypothetical protein
VSEIPGPNRTLTEHIAGSSVLLLVEGKRDGESLRQQQCKTVSSTDLHTEYNYGVTAARCYGSCLIQRCLGSIPRRNVRGLSLPASRIHRSSPVELTPSEGCPALPTPTKSRIPAKAIEVPVLGSRPDIRRRAVGCVVVFPVRDSVQRRGPTLWQLHVKAGGFLAGTA